MIRLQPMIVGVFNFMEIWKDVPNYEGYYQVSNLGGVRRVGSKSNLKAGKVHGYLQVVLCVDKQKKN